MSRIRRASIALLAFAGAALCLPAASQASCGLLGLWPCPAQPQAPQVNPDGSLAVGSNPYGLEALPQHESGEPLYPQAGHIYFGMTDNAIGEGTATIGEVASMVGSLGGSFVRSSLYWPSAEYARDAYTWSQYDSEYLTFIRQGLRPLWTVLYTPKFAAAPDATCTGRGGHYCDAEPAATADAQSELEEFGHDLAERYPLAAGFEYRNEPNLDKNKMCSADESWRVEPDAYSRDLKAFADGIRSARPEMRVLGGSLASCSQWGRGARYLSEMLDADAQDGMDGLSVHLSGGSGAHGGLVYEMDELADVLRKHHEADMRIMAGEMGFNGADSTQADRLKAGFNAINTRDPALELVENYDMFAGFVLVEHKDKGSRAFGWVRQKDMFGKFQAKQVFCEFRRLLGAGRPLPSNFRNCLFG